MPIVLYSLCKPKKIQTMTFLFKFYCIRNPIHTNLPNLPASVSVTEPPPSFQAPPTLSQIPHPQTAAAASQPHPPPMPLLSISPYQSQASRFPTPSQVPASAQVFGVPITHPASTSGRQRQPVQRGRGRAVQSIASRNMNRTKEIMIILLPRDVCLNIPILYVLIDHRHIQILNRFILNQHFKIHMLNL